MISGCSSVGYGPMLHHFCAYMCVCALVFPLNTKLKEHSAEISKYNV